MRAVFDSSKRFKQLVDAVRGVVTDANLVCTAEGMSMQGMDAAHVSLCSVILRGDGMAEYECPEHRVLGLSLETLNKMLRTIDAEDRLTLRAGAVADCLEITAMGAGERVACYAIRLMEIDVDEVGIPSGWRGLQQAEMDSVKFARAVRDIAELSDCCMVTAGTDGVSFSATGDLGSGTVRFTPGSALSMLAVDPTPTVLTVPLRYLQLFAKAGGLVPSVRLSLTAEQPLQVAYVAEWGSVIFYVAPKID